MTDTDAAKDNLEASNTDAAAVMFRALSDSSRLLILHHLLRGEHRVGELVEHLELSQSTVSQHLARLKDADLVTARPEGRATVYAVAHRAELEALLTSAEKILESTGQIVELCPTHS